MPLHLVAQDIAAGSLVRLQVDDMAPGGAMVAMSAFHPASAPPGLAGPAGRWLIDHLKARSASVFAPGAPG